MGRGGEWNKKEWELQYYKIHTYSSVIQDSCHNQHTVLSFKSSKRSITLSTAFPSGTKHKSGRAGLTQGSKTHLICEFSVGRSRAEVVHNAREAVPHTYMECCFSLLSPQVKVSLNNNFLYYHSLFTTGHLDKSLASYHFNYCAIKV